MGKHPPFKGVPINDYLFGARLSGVNQCYRIDQWQMSKLQDQTIDMLTNPYGPKYLLRTFNLVKV